MNRLSIELDPQIQHNVAGELPILEQISNETLRRQVVDAWTLALQLNGFDRISAIPGSGMPGTSELGNQLHHILAVAYNSCSLFDNLERIYGVKLGIDRELLIAGAVLHDVGKAYEYCPENLERWKNRVHQTGMLNVRHPAYGAYIALTVGLPEEVVHVCSCHSLEGRYVQRSVYATIVHYADDGSWFTLSNAFDMNIPQL